MKKPPASVVKGETALTPSEVPSIEHAQSIAAPEYEGRRINSVRQNKMLFKVHFILAYLINLINLINLSNMNDLMSEFLIENVR